MTSVPILSEGKITWVALLCYSSYDFFNNTAKKQTSCQNSVDRSVLKLHAHHFPLFKGLVIDPHLA